MSNPRKQLPRRTDEDWYRLIMDCRKSGLSDAQFCRVNGIPKHDGRMDDPKYAEKAVRKINSYIANGYFLGDNLIVSFESSGNVLNDRIIKSMISKYIS